MIVIERTDAEGLVAALEEVVALHRAIIDENIMTTFLAPLSREKALLYWLEIAKGVQAGSIHCFLAKEGSATLGCLLLRFSQIENQKHVGFVSKFLVNKGRRGHGIGKQLMAALERDASESGLSLLYLDTAKGSLAEKIYSLLGFERVGILPSFGRLPDGTMSDSVLFCKKL